uniref:Thioredoxin like 4A n=1 Tax=Leptobrachium leishanense TaxID=445787 RepID=A0A8C5PQ46_9ANUR
MVNSLDGQNSGRSRLTSASTSSERCSVRVDQAILSEEDRVLVTRFGHDWDPTCMKMDEVLYSIAEKEQAHND